MYRLDARHRRVALANLRMCFGDEKSPGEIRRLARENFRRIGENYACGIKTAVMSADELRPRVNFVMPASLRASTDELDVSEIARRSGDGGGHRQAAGFSSDKSIEEITEFLRREFAAATNVP